MGSSISKYEDLELSTAEGGLEPLPTSKKSKQFCKNCNNLVKMWIIYFATRFLERKKAFGPKNIWANPIKKMTNRIPLTNKISVGGQWVRDSPTKLYLKVLYFKNFTKSHIQDLY